MTAAEIRAKYPNPEADYGPTRWSGYCVLGAARRVLMHNDHAYGFPQSARAAHELGFSVNYAQLIADANDNGDFEKAWQLLDEALRSIPATEKQVQS